MGTELPYLVKTQICLAAFWIVYRLLFACDKAFARNRAYLLLTVAAAFVIPALSVPVWTPEATGGEPYGFRIPAEIWKTHDEVMRIGRRWHPKAHRGTFWSARLSGRLLGLRHS